jgi:hypothetical protein
MTRPLSIQVLLRAVLLVVLLLGVSCAGGKRVYPVTGKVLYEGKPAAGAVVHFHPQDKSASPPRVPMAEVGADGTFRLTTFAKGDGAPPGRYAVTVFWGMLAKEGEGLDKIYVPGRYLHPATSGLSAEVPSKATELPPFQLTR